MDGQAGESTGEGRSAGQGKTGGPRHPNWPCLNHTFRIGRVQRAVIRALVAAGQPLRSSEVHSWAPGVFRTSMLRAARRVAERVDGGKREAVWRLKPE
jgi:hypothetical protein